LSLHYPKELLVEHIGFDIKKRIMIRCDMKSL